ncbi:hypothetical protein FB645_000925 [Coemansia sp. IMI 203386]|nr:hypothetical protein FB645_000925 [Coemansia sp. IMI 203386]
MVALYEIRGKVAVVTGGAMGMGLVAVQNLVKLGAKVVLGDISEQGAKEAEKINKETGERAVVFIMCDVTDSPKLHALIDSAVNEFGRLDILINNAGVIDKPCLSDKTGEYARRCVDINVRALIDGTLHALHYWNEDEDRRGVVINTASLAAYVPMDFMATYCATKAAVAHFTKGLATLAPKVRVNAVAPAAVNTRFIQAEQLGLDHYTVKSSGILQPQDVIDQMIRLIEDETMAGDVILIRSVEEPEVCSRPNAVEAKRMLKEQAAASQKSKQ